MTEPTDVPTPPADEAEAVQTRTAEQVARSERAARLAKALRDNLKRRKAARPKRDKPGN